MDHLKDDRICKDSFFRDDFSVDQCLSRYTQKSDLDTLRKDLKNYGAELQAQMTDILKTETEAIVNLAEYLTSLNSKIENLLVPVSQLREEIRTLYDLISNAESSYRKMLENIKTNNSQRNYINLKLGIISCSHYILNLINTVDEDSPDGLITLERMVSEYSFQKNYMNELNLTNAETDPVTINVENKLLEKINKKFLNAYNENDKNTLLTCLRMCDSLNKQHEVQETFRLNVIRPALQPLFTDRYLEKCNQDLTKIYDIVWEFLQKDVLQGILIKNPDLHNFNFVLNSFWREFDKQSREGLPYITAPGNPEQFQKRFTATWELLQKIATKCGDENLIKTDETFQGHLKRFNLPVYFEIIFQQIAGSFESDTFILNLNNVSADENEWNFQLKTSIIFWKCIEKSFCKEVYIDHLADQFVRLAMMILSRYLKWFEKILQDTDLPKDENYENFIINSIIDTSVIQKMFCPSLENISTTIFAVINKLMWPLLVKVFAVNRQKLDSLKSTLKNHLINIKIAESTKYLQNVGAIPRLYRRTNRNPPKEASTYMIQAVNPIVHFHNKFKSIIKEELEEILDTIVAKITTQYLSLVQEVLMSVCKTEESLRRLKSRTVNASEDTNNSQTDTMSDEKKIREQIKYDVGYFLDKLYDFGLDDAKKQMDDLKRETC